MKTAFALDVLFPPEKSLELNMMVKTVASSSDVLIGILAVTQIQNDLLSEIIFLGILFSYELIEQLSLHVIHEQNGSEKPYGILAGILFTILPLIGFSYGYFVGISETTSVILFAIYGGSLFSLAIREIFSQERKLIFSYFLAGAALFSLIFFINISIF